jgi:2,4-dienoyl-CoA reductase-like NADH-dependent reductase (Old Yellow Enzyme family)
VLPNRIWLPAMVTWRGTEDGFVTDSVREIYLRYALGGAGMIVLEAIGVRDVASGPLLRLSHDRFVPGLKALVAEMKAVSDSLVVPQIIDFLKIARRKPTREFMEGLVRRGRLPEPTLGLSDAEFEARLEEWVPSARDRRDFRYGYRQTIEDLEPAEIRRIPGWFAAAARRARQAGFDGVELHLAHAYTLASFLSVTNGRTDAYGGCLENRMRMPLEVIAAVREEVGAEFLVGCRYLGSEDILGEDGRLLGNTLEDARRIGVELARAGLDFLSVSRGGKFDDAKQPPVGETAYPYTGHSGQTCIPRRKQDPFGMNAYLAAGIRTAVRTAGFATPRAGRGDPAGRRRGLDRDGARAAGRPRSAAQMAGGRRSGGARLRVLPLLRARRPAPPRRDLLPVAQGPRQQPPAPDAGCLDGRPARRRSCVRAAREIRCGEGELKRQAVFSPVVGRRRCSWRAARGAASRLEPPG